MVRHALTGVVWLALLATGALWVRLIATPPALPSDRPGATTAPSPSATDSAAWSRLLGSDASEPSVPSPSAPAAASTPMRLHGVIASRQGDAGSVALIAVGARPARAYRLGAELDGDTVLRAVRPTAVELSSRSAPGAVRVLALAPSGVAASPSGPLINNDSRAAPMPADSEPDNASPIVPPQPEMPTPRAADARTPTARQTFQEQVRAARAAANLPTR